MWCRLTMFKKWKNSAITNRVSRVITRFPSLLKPLYVCSAGKNQKDWFYLIRLIVLAPQIAHFFLILEHCETQTTLRLCLVYTWLVLWLPMHLAPPIGHDGSLRVRQHAPPVLFVPKLCGEAIKNLIIVLWRCHNACNSVVLTIHKL